MASRCCFNDTAQVRLFTSSIGLLILLMYFPGGLMQIVYRLRDAVLTWADRRLARSRRRGAGAGDREAGADPRRRAPSTCPESAPWLSVRDVSVRFGGNHAVDDVSLDVHAGELVGLIGTNGAGKSTLMNAIGGFVPSTGRRRGARPRRQPTCPRTAGTGSGSAAASRRRACTRR